MFDQYNKRVKYNGYDLEEKDEIINKMNLTNLYGFNINKSKKKENEEEKFNTLKYK